MSANNDAVIDVDVDNVTEKVNKENEEVDDIEASDAEMDEYVKELDKKEEEELNRKRIENQVKYKKMEEDMKNADSKMTRRAIRERLKLEKKRDKRELKDPHGVNSSGIVKWKHIKELKEDVGKEIPKVANEAIALGDKVRELISSANDPKEIGRVESTIKGVYASLSDLLKEKAELDKEAVRLKVDTRGGAIKGNNEDALDAIYLGHNYNDVLEKVNNIRTKMTYVLGKEYATRGQKNILTAYNAIAEAKDAARSEKTSTEDILKSAMEKAQAANANRPDTTEGENNERAE